MSATMETVELSQFLTFIIADEEYAVSVLKVKEIIEYDVLTKVPHVPPCIRGVINLRGAVVPVIDMALKFGLPETQVTNRTCIVIVEVDTDPQSAVVGVLVDAVSQVIEFKSDEIAEPPNFGTRIRVEHLVGMGRSGKKFVQILDTDKVLSHDELLAAELLRSEDSTDALDAAGGALIAGFEYQDDGETESSTAECEDAVIS